MPLCSGRTRDQPAPAAARTAALVLALVALGCGGAPITPADLAWQLATPRPPHPAALAQRAFIFFLSAANPAELDVPAPTLGARRARSARGVASPPVAG
jgi:hypothetical protein